MSRTSVYVRANQRNLFLHLVVGLRRLDLLIVESRHAQDLDAVTNGLTFARYDPTSRPPLWCFHFWICRLFFVVKTPAKEKTLVAIAKTLRVRSVVSSDAYYPLVNLNRYLPNVHCYFVQHGIFLNHKGSTLQIEKVFPDCFSQLTLFAIGEYDRTHYRRWGIKPLRVIPTGTLKNSVFVATQDSDQQRGGPSFDLCIVETSLKANPSNDYVRQRRDSWEKTLSALNNYCQVFKPRVLVALSSSTEPNNVLAWIKQHFPYEFSVTNHLDRFATYRAIDSSELTISQASTVSCEALSRKRKCLSVNYTEIEFWNLPGDGISRLVSPTNEELRDRINQLLTLDWESYSRQLSAELRDLMTDPSRGIGIINSTIRADLGR